MSYLTIILTLIFLNAMKIKIINYNSGQKFGGIALLVNLSGVKNLIDYCSINF